ncbi:MAG: hypothetical protein Q4C59_06155 [Lachnospiraceae bacterium]|nr:hypothetical protein [Lachnospiraceae bacterium]
MKENVTPIDVYRREIEKMAAEFGEKDLKFARQVYTILLRYMEKRGEGDGEYKNQHINIKTGRIG